MRVRRSFVRSSWLRRGLALAAAFCALGVSLSPTAREPPANGADVVDVVGVVAMRAARTVKCRAPATTPRDGDMLGRCRATSTASPACLPRSITNCDNG
jgi:hypothetical protein